MAYYLQAEPHWSLDFAIKRFCNDADVKIVTVDDLLDLDVVTLDLRIPVKEALDKIDCLIPPYGVALFHPDSVMSYLKRRAKRCLRKAQVETLAQIKELQRTRLENQADV